MPICLKGVEQIIKRTDNNVVKLGASDFWKEQFDLPFSHFEIFAIHNNIIKAKKNWKPKFGHGIIDGSLFDFGWTVFGNRALGTFEHLRNETAQHLDGMQTDLLIFTDFAEICNADRQVGKRAVCNNKREVVAIKSFCYVKGLIGNPL